MRDVDGVGLRNAPRKRAGRGEGVRTVAAQHSRHPPERVGEHADGAARAAAAVERRVVVVGHARHDEGPAIAHGVEKGFDEAAHAAFDRPNPGERRVHQQDVPPASTPNAVSWRATSGCAQGIDNPEARRAQRGQHTAGKPHHHREDERLQHDLRGQRE